MSSENTFILYSAWQFTLQAANRKRDNRSLAKGAKKELPKFYQH